jgi:hypothetical protein
MKRHAMNTNGGVQILLQALLTSAKDRRIQFTVTQMKITMKAVDHL